LLLWHAVAFGEGGFPSEKTFEQSRAASRRKLKRAFVIKGETETNHPSLQGPAFSGEKWRANWRGVGQRGKEKGNSKTKGQR
jgi:hypothetical protein